MNFNWSNKEPKMKPENETNLLNDDLENNDKPVKVPAKMVHRAVRNIMFNELGLTRHNLAQWIKESITVEVKHFIEHHFKDSELLHNQINTNIARMMKEGVSNGTWYDNESFNHYIKRIIEQEVQKQFLQNYTIEIKPVSVANNSNNTSTDIAKKETGEIK
jgi:hypothetical protein